jgi:HAD superfamily hydrolase (TIGR01549 family)
LNWLKNNNIKIGILTNGNANILLCNVLNKYSDINMNAGDIGSLKPSPLPFLSIIQRMNVLPSRVLMVGDNYHHDIIGNRIYVYNIYLFFI